MAIQEAIEDFQKKAYLSIDRCRICGNRNLAAILSLGEQALTGVFPRSKEEPVVSGPLELVRCETSGSQERCGLVQLKQTYDKNRMFSDQYGYRSGLNRSMVEHLRERVSQILKLVTLHSGEIVLDIGSNDGTLLGFYPSDGIERVGVDPTGPTFKIHYPPGVQLIPDFFSQAAFQKRYGTQKAKVITSIAMFYDLDDPLDFMTQIHQTLADDGLWVFEQSYLPTLLAMNAYDTICHEHLEYYRLKPILWMTRQVGFKIVSLERNSINGGSFCVTVAKRAAPYPEKTDLIELWLKEEESEGLSTQEPYDAFRRRVEGHRKQLREILAQMKAKGQKVVGYGASTKGNVVLQYCQLDQRDLSCIGEVNEKKFGCFTPGTRIPIVSEAQAKSLKPGVLMVLPWHFKPFFLEKEQAFLRSGGKILFPLPEPHLC